MPIKTKTILVLISLTVVSALVVLQAQNKQSLPPQQKQQVKEYTEKFPIVDYTAPELANLEERARRQAIGKKYDEAPIAISENSGTITSNTHWAVGLPALPVEKSQAIIIGQVLEAQAYLSADKTGVYSEFKIKIDEILKGESKLVQGESLIAERLGGRVRFPSGDILLSFVNGQGMPTVGQRYVLFLASDEDRFTIITGYELKQGRVTLLDNPNQHPITAYQGREEASFLKEVRNTILTASETLPSGPQSSTGRLQVFARRRRA